MDHIDQAIAARQGIAHLAERFCYLLDHNLVSPGDVQWLTTYFHALLTSYGQPSRIQELRYRVMALAHQQLVTAPDTAPEGLN